MKNKIADLNDVLRRTFTGGQVVMTAAVDAFSDDVKAQVLSKVRSCQTGLEHHRLGYDHSK